MSLGGIDSTSGIRGEGVAAADAIVSGEVGLGAGNVGAAFEVGAFAGAKALVEVWQAFGMAGLDLTEAHILGSVSAGAGAGLGVTLRMYEGLAQAMVGVELCPGVGGEIAADLALDLAFVPRVVFAKLDEFEVLENDPQAWVLAMFGADDVTFAEPDQAEGPGGVVAMEGPVARALMATGADVDPQARTFRTLEGGPSLDALVEALPAEQASALSGAVETLYAESASTQETLDMEGVGGESLGGALGDLEGAFAEIGDILATQGEAMVGNLGALMEVLGVQLGALTGQVFELALGIAVEITMTLVGAFFEMIFNPGLDLKARIRKLLERVKQGILRIREQIQRVREDSEARIEADRDRVIELLCGVVRLDLPVKVVGALIGVMDGAIAPSGEVVDQVRAELAAYEDGLALEGPLEGRLVLREHGADGVLDQVDVTIDRASDAGPLQGAVHQFAEELQGHVGEAIAGLADPAIDGITDTIDGALGLVDDGLGVAEAITDGLLASL